MGRAAGAMALEEEVVAGGGGEGDGGGGEQRLKMEPHPRGRRVGTSKRLPEDARAGTRSSMAIGSANCGQSTAGEPSMAATFCRRSAQLRAGCRQS